MPHYKPEHVTETAQHKGQIELAYSRVIKVSRSSLRDDIEGEPKIDQAPDREDIACGGEKDLIVR